MGTILLKSFVLLLFASSAFALTQSMPAPATSLEWQKLNLQERIQNQIKDSLSPILKSEKYIIEVKVDVDPTKVPAISGKGQGENKPKEKVRLSDVNVTEAPEDYVVFSKLGLEAPVYGAGEETEKVSDVELMQKSVIELSDKFNIFRYLDGVEAKIFLNEKLSDQTRAAIKSVTDNLSFNLGEIVPTVSVEYINMTEELIPEPKIMSTSEQIQYYLNWFAKFANTIGLILATLVLGMIAFMLFKKYEKLQKEQMQLMEDSMKKEQPAAAAGGAGAGAGGGAGAGAGSGEGSGSGEGAVATSSEGIDRFVKFLQHSPVQATLLVKKWIKEGSEESNNALRSIVMNLENDDLLKVFAGLSSSERSEWKSLLSKRLTKEEDTEANKYISKQIIEDIIVPSMITDNEVADLMLSITPENCAMMASENVELGTIFMNVMSSKFLTNMMKYVDSSTVTDLIERSVHFKKEHVTSKMAELKSTLKKYIDTKERSPFMDRVLELIPLATPETERPLYVALASGGDGSLLLQTAKKYFPAELVPSLPEFAIKSVLQSMALDLRAEFFASLEDDERSAFLDIFAVAGSKARDMMDMELEKFNENPEALDKVKERKDEIWKSYIDFSRVVIRNNQELARQLSPMLTEWVENLQSEAGVEIERPNLKIVA